MALIKLTQPYPAFWLPARGEGLIKQLLAVNWGELDPAGTYGWTVPPGGSPVLSAEWKYGNVLIPIHPNDGKVETVHPFHGRYVMIPTSIPKGQGSERYDVEFMWPVISVNRCSLLVFEFGWRFDWNRFGSGGVYINWPQCYFWIRGSSL